MAGDNNSSPVETKQYWMPLTLGASLGSMCLLMITISLFFVSVIAILVHTKANVKKKLSIAQQNPVYEELESQSANTFAAVVTIEKNAAYSSTDAV